MKTSTGGYRHAAQATLSAQGGPVTLYRLDSLARKGLGAVDRLPFSIKVLLESALRQVDGFQVTDEDVLRLASWNAKAPGTAEAPFKPARVILQDFTGVPCVVDLAAMRDALAKLGGDPAKINPQLPVDLVIDHSVQVDSFGSAQSFGINADIEFNRNRERYEFLRWGQRAFANFRVVPPATGIVHQVNLEYLAPVVFTKQDNGHTVAMPDSLVGTDSHTTMINGLGVLGWGVGGIEAEAVMLGQPLYLVLPEVVGFRLHGRLREGATATDLVLTVTQMLRKFGVVEKFVEFFGDGLSQMSLPDRATIANMAPEYGATVGFFPVDDTTLGYLRRTGRSADTVDLVDRYCKEQGLFRTDATPAPEFTASLELDLGTVEPCLAGPKRPQDRVPLSEVPADFRKALRAPIQERGFALDEQAVGRTAAIRNGKSGATLRHGSVVIAAITSCTNTSNPAVMIGAGLLAKKAVERGLSVKPHVKTSLAPGSRVVTAYLTAAGLMPYLEKLGFHNVGYGCTTCIGNSGPLPDPVREAVQQGNLVVAAVLSGNRNFEGRVSPDCKANYLASPPLVVAYALAGACDLDLTREPIGQDRDGTDVYLRELWPTHDEVSDAISRHVTPEKFQQQYADVFNGNERWNRLFGQDQPVSATYAWDDGNTYIQNPPFFSGFRATPDSVGTIRGARVLVIVGDSITTDHISPAGSIAADSSAGVYLQALGVAPKDFNSYGARRGNDRVMTRGTFANIRLRNLLAPGTEGGITLHLPTLQTMSIYDAAMKYRQEDTPLLVLAGAEYGTGSSRDWAAKGTMLLGVRAVLAVSFERIHRSNLVGMGVLPLQYKPGDTRDTLGLTGHEVFDVELPRNLLPKQEVRINASSSDGRVKSFTAVARLDMPVEIDYYKHGGILPLVVRSLARS